MQKVTKQKIVIGSSLVGVVVLCVGAFLLITYDYLTIRSPYVGYELGYQEANIGNEALLSPVMKDRTKAKLDSELKRNKEKYTYDEVTSIAKTVNMDYLYTGKYDVDATLLGQEDKILVSVHDTYAPMFVNLYPTLVIEQDALKSYDDLALYFNIEDFDLTADFIVLADNVDLAKEGTYSIHVTGFDTSGNYKELEVPVQIVSHKTAQLTPDILSINRLGIIPATEETMKIVGKDFFQIDVNRLNFGSKLVSGQVVTDSTTYNQKIKDLQNVRKQKQEEEQKYIDELCKDGYDSTQDEEAKREIETQRNTDDLKDSQSIQDLLNERKEELEQKREEEKKKLEEEEKKVQEEIKEQETIIDTTDSEAERLKAEEEARKKQAELDRIQKEKAEQEERERQAQIEREKQETARRLLERKSTVKTKLQEVSTELTTKSDSIRDTKKVESQTLQDYTALKPTGDLVKDAIKEVCVDQKTYDNYIQKYKDSVGVVNTKAEELNKKIEDITNKVDALEQSLQETTTALNKDEISLVEIETLSENIEGLKQDISNLPNLDTEKSEFEKAKQNENNAKKDIDTFTADSKTKMQTYENRLDGYREAVKQVLLGGSRQNTYSELYTYGEDWGQDVKNTHGAWAAERILYTRPNKKKAPKDAQKKGGLTPDAKYDIPLAWDIEEYYDHGPVGDSAYAGVAQSTIGKDHYLSICMRFANVSYYSNNSNSTNSDTIQFQGFSDFESSVVFRAVVEEETTKFVNDMLDSVPDKDSFKRDGLKSECVIRYVNKNDSNNFGKVGAGVKYYTKYGHALHLIAGIKGEKYPSGDKISSKQLLTADDFAFIEKSAEQVEGVKDLVDKYSIRYNTASEEGVYSYQKLETSGWYVVWQGVYFPEAPEI